MTTTAQHQQQQQGRQHLGFVVDNYDPDDVVSRDSPPMTAIRPSLVPLRSPSPDIPQAQVRPSSGDSVLLSYLGNGRNPEISRTASLQALATCDEESLIDEPEPEPEPKAPAAGAGMLGSSLQHLAAGALLQVCDATPPASATPAAGPRAPTAPSAPTPTRDATSVSDISDPTHRLSIRDDVPVTTFSPREPYIFPEPKHDATSPPTGLPTPATGPLPPIVDSPRSESNGQVLPSIRSQLGDFGRLSTDHLASDKDPARHGQFPRSPPANMHRFPLGVSPPVSPNDGFPRNLPSPRSLGSSPYFYTNGMQQPQQRHSNADFANHTPAETPSTDQSGSTPATSTSTSVAERMSIDGLTNPVGNYVCTFAGCTAAPFQTQYLLNSHANVHSSARPHYCPVQGCPRSEGGRGFKRKNEMIRHGLVHDSPGYVCPFCPDREHKYPRPDNLQRHVRVHHVDKDKDDPLLREVLSQRPDGLNRNRRRRGAPP